jgi:hypothetical protein
MRQQRQSLAAVVLLSVAVGLARAQVQNFLASQPGQQQQQQLQTDSAKQAPANAQNTLVQSAGQNLDPTHGAGLQLQPAGSSLGQTHPAQAANAQTCNPWSKNATLNGCVAPQVQCCPSLLPHGSMTSGGTSACMSVQ